MSEAESEPRKDALRMQDLRHVLQLETEAHFFIMKLHDYDLDKSGCDC